MRDYSTYHKPSPIRSTNKTNKTGLIIASLLLTALLIVFFSSKINFQNTSKAISDAKTSENRIPSDTKTLTQNNLIKNIETIAEAAGGTFSVYVYDINKNEEYGYHPQTVLTAASLNKIAILAALYHLAGKGEVDLEKIIIPQKGDIQDYGTGSIRYTPLGTPYSIKTLARLMMEKSDNTASYILASHIVGMDKIQNLIESWGLTQTNMSENKTSAKDMSILLVKMYKREITTPPLTMEMLNFIEKSDFDDRLPKGLPPNIKIYHKTGDEIGKIHDVGIVDLSGKPYFIGVLTSDMTDEEKAKATIAQISKIVFEEMKVGL